MKTGMHSCVLGIFMYLMPFAMVYCPQLLIVGHAPLSVIEIVMSYAFATIALSAFVQGWLVRRLSWVERGGYLVSCLLLATPEFISDFAGLLIFIALVAFSYLKNKREKKMQAAM